MTNEKTTTLLPGASAARKESERTLRKTLEDIATAQQDQRDVERKRMGASSFRARLLTMFGGVLTAAAISGFVWVWDAQTTNALQEAAIEQVRRDARNHDPSPPGHGELEVIDHALQRRVDGVEQAVKAINDRLDRSDIDAVVRHRDLLNEIRQMYRAPRAWERQ